MAILFRNSRRSSGRAVIAPILFLLLARTSGSALAGSGPAAGREIIFIESNVPDYPLLLTDVAARAEVHVLDAGQDGLAQMTEILSQRRGVRAIRLVSHGAPGAIDLGSVALTRDNLSAHSRQIAAIGAALEGGGELLLYGCEIGSGATGRHFIAELGEEARAAVAASTNPTGASALGGDWQLEARTGPIRSDASIFGGTLNRYPYLLGTNYTFTFTDPTCSGAFPDAESTWSEGGYQLTFLVTNADYILGTCNCTNDWVVDNSMSQGPITVKISMPSGTIFDLSSVDLTSHEGGVGANCGTGSYQCPLTITTSKGGSYSSTVTTLWGLPDYDHYTNLANDSDFQGISWLMITFTGNGESSGAGIRIDNLDLTNITTVAQPTVTSVAPASGPAATSVTITGTNFSYASSTGAVKFGATSSSSYTIDSDTQITAVAPAGTGTVHVTVTTAGGTSSTGSDAFTYIAAPAATTGAAGGITQNGATLNGTVNDQGAATSASFDYGTSSTPYSSNVAATPALVSAGAGNTSVSAAISSLTCNTTYHFRVTGTNSVSTTNGSDANFKTSACVPGAPTAVSAAAGNHQADITFTAPADNGGAIITSYTVTSNPDNITANGASSPITVTGLTNGTAYTFTVTATNSSGPGSPSAPSNSATPKSAQAITFANPGQQTFGTSPTLTASSDSALTVAFSSTTPLVCGITSGGVLTFVKAGTCSIDADQAGNAAYLPASTVSRSFTVVAVLPGPPRNASATAGNTEATVTFLAPLSDGGATITGYTVTSNPGGLTASGAAGPLTVTGLTNGTSYSFTVTATNSAGTGPASGASNSVTPSSVPHAPTIGAVTAGNHQATVNFTGPADDGGQPIRDYTVTSSPDGITATGASSPITVTGLTNGTSYTFTVTARSDAGTGAASASSGSATPRTVPGAPTIGSATTGNGQATVSFTGPADDGGAVITGYTVTSTPDGITVTDAASPITLTGLSNGTSYTFSVTATNGAGTSAPSAASNAVIPATAPGAPTIGPVSAGDGQAMVTFSAPASDGGAHITAYTVTSNPGNVTVTGAASPILVTGLTNGTSYTFTITASNGAGTSVPSAPSDSVTPYAAPISVRVPQTITFANPGEQTFGTTPTLSATSSSALAVTFSSSTPAICLTTSDGALTFLKAGTCTVSAAQNGNATYVAAAPVEQSFLVKAAAPGAPTMVSATAGNSRATVSFAAPSFDGGAAVTGYLVTASPGGMRVSGTASPITVTGLSNGTAYTFTVMATNGVGTSTATSSAGVVIPSPGGQVLALHDGTGGTEAEVLVHLTDRAKHGNNLTVTVATSLPASLTGYDQIWDLRYSDATALGAPERTAYLAYLQAGGLLVLVGDGKDVGQRDLSLGQMVSDAGGGTVTLDVSAAMQTVRPPFTGPATLSSLSYTGACGISTAGNGTPITNDGAVSTAMVWTPGSLSQALAGGLITVFDVDFLRSDADDRSQSLLANLMNYQTRVGKLSPTVVSVSGPSAGSYRAGATLNFTVTYNGPVAVTGTPRLPLTIGPATTWASYASGSGSTTLLFAYGVQNGDTGMVALGDNLDLTSSGSLTDADGFPARVTLRQVDLASINLDTTPRAHRRSAKSTAPRSMARARLEAWWRSTSTGSGWHPSWSIARATGAGACL